MDKLLTCAHCGCSETAEWEDDKGIYHCYAPPNEPGGKSVMKMCGGGSIRAI